MRDEKLEPLHPGSIKDRIVCSVWALGELATPAAVRKSVDCNGSLLQIAIEGLLRDGYLYIGPTGRYEINEEFAATLKPADRREIARAEPVNSNQGVSPMREKKCPACEDVKNIDQFDKGMHRCRECVSGNVSVKRAKKGGKAPSAKAKSSPKLPTTGEFVIPASGQIHCLVMDGPVRAFVLQQGNDSIACSIEQLQILRDWASSQLKKI